MQDKIIHKAKSILPNGKKMFFSTIVNEYLAALARPLVL